MTIAFFREDKLIQAALRHPTNTAFVIGAARRGYDCTTERSHINGRYRTQVNQHSPERAYNLAEGYGDTPLESQVNAFVRVIPTAGDPVWGLLLLEANVRLFGEALERQRAREARDRRNEERLAKALDHLETLLADSGRFFHWDQP